MKWSVLFSTANGLSYFLLLFKKTWLMVGEELLETQTPVRYWGSLIISLTILRRWVSNPEIMQGAVLSRDTALDIVGDVNCFGAPCLRIIHTWSFLPFRWHSLIRHQSHLEHRKIFLYAPEATTSKYFHADPLDQPFHLFPFWLLESDSSMLLIISLFPDWSIPFDPLLKEKSKWIVSQLER